MKEYIGPTYTEEKWNIQKPKSISHGMLYWETGNEGICVSMKAAENNCLYALFAGLLYIRACINGYPMCYGKI